MDSWASRARARWTLHSAAREARICCCEMPGGAVSARIAHGKGVTTSRSHADGQTPETIPVHEHLCVFSGERDSSALVARRADTAQHIGSHQCCGVRCFLLDNTTHRPPIPFAHDLCADVRHACSRPPVTAGDLLGWTRFLLEIQLLMGTTIGGPSPPREQST